ncbi:hypothetical protein PIB30_074711 [Stylosanthes scabra]|uniref:Uncharacterized protein n=1 Tax=Stylosanthes scabra TaxID=79078 RepID=A0ABU6ZNP4_9FABA|nr:hypothetical protein [Stylosanthes scabra]
MSNIFRSLSRRLSIRGSSSSSSSSLPSPNPLTEKVTQPEELYPKHKIFEEEVCFEDINQAIDNWEIPKIPQDQLYVPDDNKRKSDYIIKTAENNIPLGPESGEEFHLLTKQSVREHTRHYKYLHIGCVQQKTTTKIREVLRTFSTYRKQRVNERVTQRDEMIKSFVTNGLRWYQMRQIWDPPCCGVGMRDKKHQCRGDRVRHWRLVAAGGVTHGWAAALHQCMCAVMLPNGIGWAESILHGRAAALGQSACRLVALRHWSKLLCRW